MSQSLNFYCYDLETYPNCFLWSGKFRGKSEVQVFEMSFRKNDKEKLLSWLSFLQNSGAIMVGYNNLGFDYPITHKLLNNIHTFTHETAYDLCQQIINSHEYGFETVKNSDRILPQVDLMKINHFDNKNKRTSLKALQFAMRSESVEDLPFKPGTYLTSEQIDVMISYNVHDITETEKFLNLCEHHIIVRKELIDQGVLSGDVMNFSDVKLGTEFLIKKIGRHKCFHSGYKPRQTFRESIAFKDIILPKIFFRTEPFQEVLDWFNKQVIWTKSEDDLPHLDAKLAGLEFHFGVGGVHASVESKKFESNSTHVIRDVDVSGMYPAIAIANGFYPEHLGQEFVDAYKQLQIDRSQYKKGTTMNLILKLASNGVFGVSDNSYSCFYDPRFPKQITVNGQLQLIQLAEVLSMIPQLQIIQANTDGITAYMPREMSYLFDMWCKDWETISGLKLEYAEFKKMWIRDVNNYLAITSDGKVKSKGAYWYPKEPSDYWGSSGSNWNKDFSAMVIQKITEQSLINDWNPDALIRLMTDPFDFMIRYKTPAGSTVYIGDQEQQKTVRYYVSKSGKPMKKISKPKGEIGAYKRKHGLQDSVFNKIMKEIPAGTWDERIHMKNKAKYTEVETGIEAGKLVKQCNHVKDFDWSDLDYDYYLKEIKKLEIV